jgi:hypothetical protein
VFYRKMWVKDSFSIASPTLHQPFSSSGRPMRLIATCFASRVEAKPEI